jgi:hypothetical protein
MSVAGGKTPRTLYASFALVHQREEFGVGTKNRRRLGVWKREELNKRLRRRPLSILIPFGDAIFRRSGDSQPPMKPVKGVIRGRFH